ncbi:MAG: hypothetical protein GY807_06530 [Gammaproteobacteria bacterium]|nr:hypothetical protein [Gammaproteobacteria bacterium]
MRLIHSVTVLAFISTVPLSAQENENHSAAPYAGQQQREIAALSAADVDELQKGGGWGLARPAELNGVPGPAHLLEMQDAIGLTSSQIAALVELRDRMRADAISQGLAFLVAERALDAAFTDAIPQTAQLKQLVMAAGEARATLRLIHLSAHLETPEILTPNQIEKYNVLRGYSDDPCEVVPEGHDAIMWRQHNGCE